MAPASAPTSRPLILGSPTAGWDDHRPFLGAETARPVERLVRARADGSLEPVSIGSLAGVDRIYACVHGWAPGSQTAADLIRAHTGAEPRAWDDGMVDMYGFSLAESFNPLLAALAASDPQAAVVWFSWVDESATAGEVFAGAQSLSHTQINGARLAKMRRRKRSTDDTRTDPGPAGSPQSARASGERAGRRA